LLAQLPMWRNGRRNGLKSEVLPASLLFSTHQIWRSFVQILAHGRSGVRAHHFVGASNPGLVVEIPALEQLALDLCK
jgi:hypothetical protein